MVWRDAGWEGRGEGQVEQIPSSSSRSRARGARGEASVWGGRRRGRTALGRRLCRRFVVLVPIPVLRMVDNVEPEGENLREGVGGRWVGGRATVWWTGMHLGSGDARLHGRDGGARASIAPARAFPRRR